MYTHIVHNGSPALKCNTLEDGEHGETKVVEVGNAPVRSVPIELTVTLVGGTFEPLPTRVRGLQRHLPL